MKKILITEFMEQDSVDSISELFEVIYDPSLHENIESLESQIELVEAVIVRNKTQLNESLLLKAKNLKFVGRLGVGLDNIDTNYCHDNNNDTDNDDHELVMISTTSPGRGCMGRRC